MPENENFPELLRERLVRRRRRFKIVMGSLGVSVCSAIVVFFLMAGTVGGTAGSRILYALPGPGDSTWLIDQSQPVPGQTSGNKDSFRLLEHSAATLREGPSFGGTILSVVGDGKDTMYATSGGRLLRFKLVDAQWKLEDSRNLGLNDSGAGAVVATYKDSLWLFWIRGAEIMARPALKPEAEPLAVFKAASPISRIGAKSAAGAVWLSALESRTGQLLLIAAKPEEAADGKVTVEIVRKGVVPMTASRSSFAVFGDDARNAVPVIALTRKEDTTRTWLMQAWVAGSSPEGEWKDVPPPPRAGAASTLELTSFVTLVARGNELTAWYSDAGTVKRTQSTWTGPEGLNWGEPTVVELDAASGVNALVWGAILFGLALVMTSQFVWLILNRERPQDRAITSLIAAAGGKKPAPKPEQKLVFASGPARGLALLIDLAMTSPLVILLQRVYEYRWEDAYGFIVLVNWGAVDSTILQAIAASLVTLSLLVMYSLFCELTWGRTLGKALLRLRVVDMQGETPSPWRIVVRNLLKIPEMIHWTVLIIPLGLMLFSGRQQRLGDLAGGTLVVVDVVPEESPDDIDI